ncbi:MAG: hypothetical protein HYV26_14710 [Candidatus Hydrogenedentes bacterium]|nr:hypothetical protein [Candidatus Hydrogenedentota bacterium]MBI3119052.1 hypothetical protein [Candidatus Hydrogenedentota bacterium]
MMPLPEVVESLAGLLDYPQPGLEERVNACIARLDAVDPEAAEHVRQFGGRIAGSTLAELEELYIKTFDLNPLCTLDLGWQLFGEDYNRGLFLVKIRQEMKRLGVAETAELPDHLTLVLKLLGRMEPDKAEDFATACVLPAVRKIRDGIVKDANYRPLIEAVVRVLAHQYERTSEEINDGVLV